MKKPDDQVIMTFSEFLANAHTSDLFQQVADEIAQEQKDAVVVDCGAPTDEEWAFLSSQKAAAQAGNCEGQPPMVGSEGNSSKAGNS